MPSVEGGALQEVAAEPDRGKPVRTCKAGRDLGGERESPTEQRVDRPWESLVPQVGVGECGGQGRVGGSYDADKGQASEGRFMSPIPAWASLCRQQRQKDFE